MLTKITFTISLIGGVCGAAKELFSTALQSLFLHTPFQLDRNEDCTGISEYVPGLTDIVETVWYGTVFRFYIRCALIL